MQKLAAIVIVASLITGLGLVLGVNAQTPQPPAPTQPPSPPQFLGVGGVLGVGEKLVSVPWSAVKVNQDNGKIVVVTDQKMLEPAPTAGHDRRNEGAASPSTSGGSQGSQNR